MKLLQLGIYDKKGDYYLYDKYYHSKYLEGLDYNTIKKYQKEWLLMDKKGQGFKYKEDRYLIMKNGLIIDDGSVHNIMFRGITKNVVCSIGYLLVNEEGKDSVKAIKYPIPKVTENKEDFIKQYEKLNKGFTVLDVLDIEQGTYELNISKDNFFNNCTILEKENENE